MKTQFKCSRCGEYDVTEDMFNAFTTPEQREEIKRLPKVTRARLKFSGGCPKCLPQNKTHTRVAELEVGRLKG